MGNLRHLPAGQDFSASDFAREKDFGFSGSAQGYDSKGSAAPPFAADKPTDNGPNLQNYAEGGKVEHHGGHHRHVHPHGHEVTHVEHAHHGVIMHHAHGGMTVHHHDGHVSHHHAHGGEIGGMMGQMGEGPGEGTHVAKRMATKAVHQHEEHDHPGKPETDMQLARGGAMRPHIPRSAMPKGGHEKSPINTAPRNPQRNPSARNAMPGGQMGYGVEPSAEPDDAGTEQGIPQLARGGRAKARGGMC